MKSQILVRMPTSRGAKDTAVDLTLEDRGPHWCLDGLVRSLSGRPVHLCVPKDWVPEPDAGHSMEIGEE